jgi:hypothetical protein
MKDDINMNNSLSKLIQVYKVVIVNNIRVMNNKNLDKNKKKI